MGTLPRTVTVSFLGTAFYASVVRFFNCIAVQLPFCFSVNLSIIVVCEGILLMSL
jgi:hypothetical protein